MKKTLFIMTHLESGWESLARILEECHYLQVFQTNQSYSHPEDVKLLHQQKHKWPGPAAICADVIFHNKDFSMKRLCEHYQFIFWSCSLDECLEKLIKNQKYGRLQAEDYWYVRLEGMRQYHQRSPGSLWNPPLHEETVLASVLG